VSGLYEIIFHPKSFNQGITHEKYNILETRGGNATTRRNDFCHFDGHASSWKIRKNSGENVILVLKS
jgi:hypothetical protein